MKPKSGYTMKFQAPENGKPTDKDFSKISETVFTVLLSPIYWTVCLIIVILFLPFFLIRFLVIQLCQLIHPTWIPLSMHDNILAEDDVNGKPNSVIVILCTVENPPAIEEYRTRHYNEFLKVKDPKTGQLLFPKYQQYVESWLGYNFWKWDNDFRIENHIKPLETTAGLKFVTEEKLMECSSTLINQGFPVKRPAWDILIVENFVLKEDEGKDENQFKKKSVFIFRIHHGMADGYSLIKTNMKYLCKQSIDDIVKPRFNRPKSSLLTRIWNGFYTFASMPNSLVKQQILEIDSNVLFKSESQLTRDCLVTQSAPLSVDVIKLIKNRYNVSFNAVVYSALAGGFRKYLRQMYLNGGRVEIPDVIRTFAPFPWKNHPNDAMVNHWTCAVVPLLTGLSDPIERLLRTEEEFDNIKSSSAPLANYLSIKFSSAPPTIFTRHCAKNWFSTAIVSAFPGPKKRFKLLGEYEVSEEIFWAPHLRGSAGIGIAVLTYCENLRFCLNVDKAIIPDRGQLNELVGYIEEEIQILTKSVEQMQQRSDRLSIIPEEDEYDLNKNWKSSRKSSSVIVNKDELVLEPNNNAQATRLKED